MKKTLSLLLVLTLTAASLAGLAYADKSQSVQVKYTVTPDALASPSPAPIRPTIPKTGDDSKLVLLASLCGAGCLIGAGVVVYLVNKKNEEQCDE